MQGMFSDLPARGALRLRSLLRPARGRLLAADVDPEALKRRIQAGPHTLWRYADFLPLEGQAARSALPTGLDAAGARRPPRRAPRARASCGSRTRPRTPRTRSRTASSPSRSPARRSSASTPSPAPRPATSPTRSPRTPPPPACPPTSSSRPTSRSRRSSPPAPTAPTWSPSRATTTRSTACAPSSSAEREGWAFVNVNVRPYYAEGSKTLAFETAEQLGWELPGPRRRADRLRLAVHQDRARLRGVDRRRAARGRACRT